jgi:hypothetical protein
LFLLGENRGEWLIDVPAMSTSPTLAGHAPLAQTGRERRLRSPATLWVSLK